MTSSRERRLCDNARGTGATAYLASVLVACEDANQPVATSPEISLDERRRSSSDELGPSPIGGRIPVAVRLVAQNLTSPITIISADDRTGRLFIVDQTGTIHILTRRGELLPTPFLDVRGRMVPLMPNFDERGLLGLAFHPDYRKNGRFFVYYARRCAPVRRPVSITPLASPSFACRGIGTSRIQPVSA
jgi:glucose/arabinose dehydrogenase